MDLKHGPYSDMLYNGFSNEWTTLSGPQKYVKQWPNIFNESPQGHYVAYFGGPNSSFVGLSSSWIVSCIATCPAEVASKGLSNDSLVQGFQLLESKLLPTIPNGPKYPSMW